MSPGGAHVVPSRGDEIVVRQSGASRRGRVEYADQVQILVKWNDGGSSSLRIGHTPYEVIPPSHSAPADPGLTGEPEHAESQGGEDGR